MTKYPVIVRLILVLLFIILLIYVLTAAKLYFVPVFLGMILTFLLLPAARKMEEAGIPRISTNLILILLSLAALLLLTIIFTRLIANFVEDLPALEEKIINNLTSFQLYIYQKLGIDPDRQQQYVKDFSSNFLQQSGLFFQRVFSATTTTIYIIGILPVYTFLFLYYRNKFESFIFQLVKDDHKHTAEKIINEISTVTPKYLRGLLMVVGVLIIINSVGFMIIGVEQPIFFGLVAALFNIIPVLGTIFGFLVVLIFVLATQTINVALGVLVMFFIVQFSENNILTPNITGSQVSINPMVIIMGVILGGMLYGFAGMFIIIPFIGMFKILCDNVESLKPIGFLMGTKGTEKYALTITPVKNYFKKLFNKEKKPNKYK